MSARDATPLNRLLNEEQDGLLQSWMEEQLASGARLDMQSKGSLEQQSAEFLKLLRELVSSGVSGTDSEEGDALRDFLAGISRTRAHEGYTPTETATFVFSLKKVLFRRLQAEVTEPEALGRELWHASRLLDELGLYTTEQYQRGREEVIRRQQHEILELSTPVVKLWEGVVAVPLIGTLDSARTQVVMESLLERIVETNASIAIIDITGVPTVDTLVAQHLIKTVAAARLMGAECIISGIRPQIAQTIVHLGIELEEVSTKASLADALATSFARLGFKIARG